MSADLVLLLALAGLAILSSLGVLASKDNFYSSLFMSLTLIFVAVVYALFNLQPVFILIVFIFVGAIGIVTVALAATHRFEPREVVRQVSWPWIAPVAITALILGLSIHSYAASIPQTTSLREIEFELANFLSIPGNILLVLLLISLVVLLLLSVLRIGVGGRG